MPDELTNYRPQRRNANRHTARGLGALEKSIQADGWIGAITVAADGETFDGSARIEVGAATGFDDAIVVRSDGSKPIVHIREDIPTADDPRALRLGVAANRVAQLDYDPDPALLAELAQEVDLSGLYYDDELAALLASVAVEPGAGGDEFDTTPEDGPTRTQVGDIFALGEHRLLCGDSTNREHVQALTDGTRADLLLTDPPYGKLKIFAGGTVIGVANAARRRKYDPSAYRGEGNFQIKPVLDAVEGLYDRAVIWGGNYFADVLPISTAWLVWDKRAGERAYFSDCELAWTNLPTGARVFTHTWQGMIRAGEDVEREHPTQKPVELMLWVLRGLMPAARLVLDLFGGSGTTLIACQRAGVTCRMMELSEQYCDIILRRWETETGQEAKLERRLFD